MPSVPKFSTVSIWLDDLALSMHPTFNREGMGVPANIFRVPETISVENPDAYKPQLVGLGPYHHFQQHLYKKRWQKIGPAKQILTEEQLLNFKALVVDRIGVPQLQLLIRICYDSFLEIDGHALSWLMSVDGVFLISQFYNGVGREGFVRDIMMLENQVPMFVLTEILRSLGGLNGEFKATKSEFREKVIAFCLSNSPLVLTEARRFRYEYQSIHLLDFMYNLIVNNRGLQELVPWKLPGENRMFEHCVEIGGNYASDAIEGLKGFMGMVGAKHIEKGITFAQALPWDKVSSLIGVKLGSDELDQINAQEIRIPSVSQLSEIGEVEFRPLEREGIRDIKFDGENRTFYLPVIKLNKNSEVILRNLVAYEALRAKEMESGSSLELAEYVDLMCGIVDTAKDVEELRNKGIIVIEADFGDEEVAKMFNGMKKTTGEGERKYGLEKIVEKVNEGFDKTAKVKFYRFMKNHVYRSWKFLTFLATVMLIGLMVLQAFCDVYGCSNRFFQK